MPGEANASASLELLLKGIDQVLSGLQKLEDKLTSIKSLSGGIVFSGMGGGGGNGNISGTNSSGVTGPSNRSGALFGDTAGPASQSTQFNPPSARAEMDVLGLSDAGTGAGMYYAANASGIAISDAIRALPGRGESSFAAMNTIHVGEPMYGDMPYNSSGGSAYGFGTRGGRRLFPGMLDDDAIFNASPQFRPSYGPIGSYNSYGPDDGIMSGSFIDPFNMSHLSRTGSPTYSYSPMGPVPPPVGGTLQVGASSPIGGRAGGRASMVNSMNVDPNDPLANWKLGQYLSGGLGSKPLSNPSGGASGGDEPEEMSMMSLIGLHFALRQFEAAQAVNNTLYTNSIAKGTPLYTESFMPQNIQMGLTLGGAVIGSMIPGLGPAVGAAAGAYIGQSFTAIQPYIDRDIQQKQLNQIYGMGGLGPASTQADQQLQFMRSQAASGFPIPGTWNNFQSHTDPMSAAGGAAVLGIAAAGGIVAGLFAGTVASALGTPILGAGVGIATGFAADATITTALNAAWEVQGSEAGIFSRQATDDQKKAFMSLATNPFIQQRLGSYLDHDKLTGKYVSDVISAGASIDPVAAQNAIEGLNPGYQTIDKGITDAAMQAAGNQARSTLSAQIDLQARQQVISPFLSIDREKSRLGGYIGLANYYDKGTAGQYKSYLQDAMEVNSGNPAAVAGYGAELATLNFQAGKDVESAIFRQSEAEVLPWEQEAIGRAKYSAISGSAATSGNSMFVQAAANRVNAGIYGREIRNNQYVYDPAQIDELRAKVAQLQADAKILDYQGMISNAKGAYSISTTQNMEQGTQGNLGLIYGLGGAQAGTALQSIYNARVLDVRAAQTLLSAFPDSNSAEALAARQTLAGAQVSAMQARESQATVPYGGYVQAERYQLQGSMSAIEAGLTPAGPGDIRRNLEKQMALTKSHISDIDTAAAKLSTQEGGHLDPAQAQEFAKQRSEAVTELSQMAKEFNYGYMDRLISIAYNMPQQSSWYLRSQASNREASQYGVVHPSIGGTKDQLQQMAALGYDLRHIASAPGAGSPAGFNQQAMGAGSGAVRLPVITVPIEITDARSGNVLAKNDVMFENGKSVTDFRSRTPLASRPSA